MSVNCKYCNEPEDKQSKPGLGCEVCSCFIHIPCLRRQGTPGDFTCDVFFKFTCEDCSPEKKELFVRYKFSWVNVIYLTLHHLSNHSYGISHHGYFHYKTHICSFIDRYWQTLFGFSSKQKKNWVGTIAGVLSVYNKLFFKSGSVALGEAGWWRLLHNFSPAVAAHIIQEIAKDKPKNRPRSQPSMDRNHFLAKIAEMGYKELINDDVEDKPLSPAPPPAPARKRRLDSDGSGSSFQPDYDTTRPDFLDNVKYEDTISTSEYVGAGYGELSHAADYALPASLAAPRTMQSDTSSVTSYQNIVYYDSDSRSGSDIDKKPPVEVKQKPVVEEKEVRRESLFSTELNSEGMPWLDQEYYEEVYNKKEESKTKEVTNIKEEHSKPKEDLVEMTPYEEVQLFKKIEGMISKVKDPSKRAYLYRFRAKLRLRRLKRHKHLPLFDLDKLVKQLGGYATEELSIAVNIERVLDRFQRSYLLDKLCGTISWSSGATLVGGGAAALRSPYSGALLKPYIRRDRAARPLWLRLTDELLRKTNKHIKGYEPPARPSLDYSYVQPHHIAAVNNLCAQFFWPGIDLTEALQYPEFSCVVTFGQLVVGCAFLVPDAGPQRAYVSFVLTRPEWRRAGIATFMLYHLLQTCTGQDVTLHVSPTNPAIFLYQKFGFKVEELIQDFYEKYYDIDYKGCRHALFLRLVR